MNVWILFVYLYLLRRGCPFRGKILCIFTSHNTLRTQSHNMLQTNIDDTSMIHHDTAIILNTFNTTPHIRVIAQTYYIYAQFDCILKALSKTPPNATGTPNAPHPHPTPQSSFHHSNTTTSWHKLKKGRWSFADITGIAITHLSIFFTYKVTNV